MNRSRVDKDMILRLREQGLSLNEIAKEVDCTPQYVSIVCQNEEQKARRLEAQRAYSRRRYHKDRVDNAD